MNKNLEIEIVNLVKKIDQLPEQDKKNIIEFAQNNEWELALDSLAHQIYEYDIHIKKEIFETIIELGKEMEIESNTWLFLKKQII